MFDYLKLKKNGVIVPEFDIDKIVLNTFKAPKWLHFGAGNIFRIFPALLAQEMLKLNLTETGVIVAEGFDLEIIDKVFKPYNNQTVAVTLKSDGKIITEVVSSMTHAYKANISEDDFTNIVHVFENSSLQMVSFTITEKGYELLDGSGNYFKNVLKDFESGFFSPESYMGMITYLLFRRFGKNRAPLALVSLDNYSKNGDKLKGSILTIAKKWTDKGFVPKEFVDYLSDKSRVSFPWTMIDKITPRPDRQVALELEKLGFEEFDIAITSKNTYVAPFVNAEEAGYLVIEDLFPNGRPPLERVGVLFTDQQTVDKIEKMKVGTCLNPLHTSLAIFGCLLGFDKISTMMKDELMVKLIERIGYVEGLPVVVDPKIINPKAFIDEVINVRLPNPFIPDTPQRIATDTSQKIAVRFGQTINSYLKKSNLNIDDLIGIPLTLAGWIRYLMGIDDQLKKFIKSSDPLSSELYEIVKDFRIGKKIELIQLEGLFSNQVIFGLDLNKTVLPKKIVSYLNSFNMGNEEAIRITLEKVLN